MEPFQAKDPSFLMIDKWKRISPRLQAGISTRFGGVSPDSFSSLNLGFHVPDSKNNVLQNRRILAEKLNIPLHSWIMGEQIHGTSISVVSKGQAGLGAFNHADALAGVDGMITQDSGVLCVAMFADCVPLFFFDPVSGWIGIAHAGWKGTVNKMASKMVEAMSEHGVNTNEVEVVIGPCISQAHYEVDQHVIQYIPDDVYDSVVINNGNGHFMLDLKELNYQLLVKAEVKPQNIAKTNYCTFKDDIFFSHRKDNGITGRFVGFIGYEEKT
ncbi:peptidoglycan editing factor PgeF [Aquibacillus salsiterrae]|uniref:Purine nucleoside phosphorylase n=1 Tax=Aquibacillus salsiterrae TaxID=2950439 RepID=A0A9X4AFX1_9BACI|nr:peptidoglycan editing factor PgeF [Aquibacillus salsiterrae]MDC3416468.1 peptidoglycan editing factor PgeF [Aquibacillus salsiterrae]